MALVDDDDVERLRRHRRTIGDLLGWRRPAALVITRLLVLLRQIGAGQLREDALDGRDDDLRGRVEPRCAQPLDVVELGEQPAGPGRAIGLELLERLSTQIVAIDEEQDAPRIGMGEQAVGERRGGEGLACPRRHSHERARPIAAERRFQPLDRVHLAVSQAVGDERRHVGEPRAQRRPRLQPRVHRLRPVEREHAARAVERIGAVGEQDFGARRLIVEPQRIAPPRQRLAGLRLVAARLLGDAGQCGPRRLGLDDAARLARDEQQIVARAGRQRVFADGHAQGGATVQVGTVLDHPTRRLQLSVNHASGEGLWCRHRRRYGLAIRSYASTHRRSGPCVSGTERWASIGSIEAGPEEHSPPWHRLQYELCSTRSYGFIVCAGPD